uniref:Uncharacterized protein n=1 Tax=viral metagenome TaxID=1070528 RepID=A0A6C0I184_9ZZZZ
MIEEKRQPYRKPGKEKKYKTSFFLFFYSVL